MRIVLCVAGQTLWNLSREEYDRLAGNESDPLFPTPDPPDEDAEEIEAQTKVMPDYFKITRGFA